MNFLKKLLVRYNSVVYIGQHPPFFVPQTLTTVKNGLARMVEIVEMKLMISAVIVSPDTQGKPVPLVRKVTFIIDFLQPSQIVLSSSSNFTFNGYWFIITVMHMSINVPFFVT